jgi:hypothetical protein
MKQAAAQRQAYQTDPDAVTFQLIHGFPAVAQNGGPISIRGTALNVETPKSFTFYLSLFLRRGISDMNERINAGCLISGDNDAV